MPVSDHTATIAAEVNRGETAGKAAADAMMATGVMTFEDVQAMMRGFRATKDTPFYEGFKSGFAYAVGAPHPACDDFGGHFPHTVFARIAGEKFTVGCPGRS